MRAKSKGTGKRLAMVGKEFFVIHGTTVYLHNFSRATRVTVSTSAKEYWMSALRSTICPAPSPNADRQGGGDLFVVLFSGEVPSTLAQL
jgi:hypothetical protein